MTEDEMYDIICGYEDSERDYHERNIELEAENAKLREGNAKLREFAADACTVLRNHYDKDWFDGTIFAERMRELGIEVRNV